MNKHEAIRTCLGCPHLQRPNAHGKALCGIDGFDLHVHGEGLPCPEGKFVHAEGVTDIDTISHWARGVIGISKAIAGADRAPTEVIAKRRLMCKSCPESRSLFGVLKYCNKCGCSLALKTTLKSEACPMEKWGKVEP